MRDITRIDLLLQELKVFWITNPDLRFGQIVEILKNKSSIDLFYVEDEIITLFLQNISQKSE